MDPWRYYQLLYGSAAAAGLGGLGAAGYGTFNLGKGIYNAMKRPSRVSRAPGRYVLKGCRKTRSYRASVAGQKTITAPMSRIIDTKYIDKLQTFSGLKRSSNLNYILNELAGGSTEGQRVGNDIRIIKYFLSFEIKHGSDVSDQTFRVLVVRWKVGNDNTNPGFNLLFNTDANGDYSPSSLRNPAHIEDFEILLDRTVVMPQQASAGHGLVVKQFVINTCYPVRFSGTGSTSVVRNPTWIYLMTNGVNTTTGASGQFSVRTMYSDI